ncbi:uncharacterized protein BDV14DRAFT_179782 [Aspergillus stella-maris]|uniref:uncharacterized protein n=1 Tax=Aspergillus stella-maris TaxID=1810926 RepID=UPI003CCDEF08
MITQYAMPLLALLAWTTFLTSVNSSSSVTYCSSDSTGSGAANFSIYQSNGNCEEHCSGSAFAILMDKNCWCSDIAPNEDSTVDTSDCSDGCPGFPDDSCGNADDGYYAYIQIGSPSGTASASSTSTSTSTSTSSKTTSTDDSTTTTTDSDTDSETSTTTTFTSIETHGNQVTTVTVEGSSEPTSAAESSSDTQTEDSDSDSGGISGGSIAGIVIGVVGGIALVVAAIVFFLAKRRRDNGENYQGNSIDGRQSKGSNMSYANLGDNQSHTLSSGSGPQRVPTFTDNRLNTGAVLYPNGHRDSDVSLHDNEDYSRPVLRLTNPD